MRPLFSLSIIVVLATFGCAETSANRTESVSENCGTFEVEVEAKQLTFYQDILPILKANTAGHSYKCTTCHAHYSEPDGLNSVPEINRIIDSMESGRMPLSSNRVPKKLIDVFRVWQKHGFRTGNRNDPERSSKINRCLTGVMD
jgi:hypothetical protein